MSKLELIAVIAEKNKITKVDATKALEMVVEGIKEQVVNDNTVVIREFGKFSPVVRPKRMGRNPQTGEAIEITERKAVTFKPSLAFKKSLN